jgi:hypothetical protein
MSLLKPLDRPRPKGFMGVLHWLFPELGIAEIVGAALGAAIFIAITDKVHGNTPGVPLDEAAAVRLVLFPLLFAGFWIGRSWERGLVIAITGSPSSPDAAP